jgi:cutinase
VLTTGIPASQANPAGCANINLAGETRNDITSGLPCKNFTLIFARGTFENGNIGGLVGPPFVTALVSMLGSSRVAVQGVNNYPANVAGFLAGGSTTGSADMAQVRPMTLCLLLP